MKSSRFHRLLFSACARVNRGKVLKWILIVLPGAILLYITAPFGLGSSSDSSSYILTAYNVMHGLGVGEIDSEGVFHPLTHWPPLLPVLLGYVSDMTGMSPLETARYLNAIIYCLNIFLFQVICRNISIQTGSLTTIGSLILIGSESMLNTHALVWSEPLFIFFLLLSYYLLLKAGEGSIRIAILLGFALAFASLTRYAGIFFFILIILYLVVFQGWGIRKWRQFAWIAGIYSLVFGGWLLRNIAVSGRPTSRRFHVEFFGPEYYEHLFHTIKRWLLPFHPWWIYLLFFGAGIIVIVTLANGKHLLKPEINKIINKSLLAGMLIIGYLCCIWFSKTFFDHGTPFDVRILSPVFPFGLLILLIGSNKLLNILHGFNIGKIALTVFLITILGSTAINAVYFGQQMRSTGWLYTGSAFNDEQTRAYLLNFRPDEVVYSNVPAAIRIQTGKQKGLYALPASPGQERYTPEDDLSPVSSMIGKLRDEKGVIFYYRNAHINLNRMDTAFIESIPSLKLIERLSLANVYAF